MGAFCMLGMIDQPGPRSALTWFSARVASAQAFGHVSSANNRSESFRTLQFLITGAMGGTSVVAWIRVRRKGEATGPLSVEGAGMAEWWRQSTTGVNLKKPSLCSHDAEH